MERAFSGDAVVELLGILPKEVLHQRQSKGDDPQEFCPAHAPIRSVNPERTRATFPHPLAMFRIRRSIRMNPHGIIGATPIKDVFVVGSMVSELIPRCYDRHIHTL